MLSLCTSAHPYRNGRARLQPLAHPSEDFTLYQVTRLANRIASVRIVGDGYGQTERCKKKTASEIGLRRERRKKIPYPRRFPRERCAREKFGKARTLFCRCSCETEIPEHKNKKIRTENCRRQPSLQPSSIPPNSTEIPSLENSLRKDDMGVRQRETSSVDPRGRGRAVRAMAGTRRQSGSCARASGDEDSSGGFACDQNSQVVMA
jgi:hypothetical protein